MLAEASNMDGPTLVPHMVRPILGQPREFPARKRFSPAFLFFLKLAQYPMPISTIK
jgi:hypothetical protein